MNLLKLRVRGFQSFHDSGDLELRDGVNLIVGQNNAGKSALLRAMKHQLVDDRHRTPDNWATHLLPVPVVQMQFEVSGGELRAALLQQGSQITFPVPSSTVVDVNGFIDSVFVNNKIAFNLERAANTSFVSRNYPSHGLFRDAGGTVPRGVVVAPNNGEILLQGTVAQGETLPHLLNFMWNTHMFYFSAERFAVGQASHGHAERLLPNASNLPNVLATMSGSQGSVFRNLVRHLRAIFATVGNLSVGPMPGNSDFEIRIWPTEAMNQIELSFPLNLSGTGVARLSRC